MGYISNQERSVVNIIGLPGCGKSTACNYLADLGFEVVKPSDTIREFADKQHINLKSRADYVEAHRLMNLWNPLAIVEPILNSKAAKICTDGLRSTYLLEVLQSRLPRVVTIALDCPLQDRWQHALTDDARRGTHRTAPTIESFAAIEQPDLFNPDPNLPNMTEMLKRADFRIDASQPKDTVFAELDHIVQLVTA
jgi:adenylate kinase family enzyme